MGWNELMVLVGCMFGLVYSQNSCITPNGETAQCISIYKCSTFINALANRTSDTIKFMRESRCGYMEDPLVCCGNVVHYISRSSSTTTPSPSLPNVQPLEHPNIGLLPSNKSCSARSQDRILGGTSSGLGEFPWMALLEYKDSREQSQGYSCGGVLISERYVVTAAHCIVGKIQIEVGQLFKVRFGEYNLDTEEDCDNKPSEPICSEPVVDVDVEDYVVHPQYDDNSRNKFHDIALIRLKTPIKITAYIIPICLPMKGEATPVGENVTIAGWGYTEHGAPSSTLLKAEIPIASSSVCTPVYKAIGTQISKAQVCAGGKKGVDSCSGDSGGPLMGTYNSSAGILRGKLFLEGVVSYGTRECGKEGFPAVYTKVGQYVGWILDNLKPS